MFGQILGLVFTFGLSAAILESQNRQWTRDVKKRKKTIERKRIEESRRSGVLRSTRREQRNVGRKQWLIRKKHRNN